MTIKEKTALVKQITNIYEGLRLTCDQGGDSEIVYMMYGNLWGLLDYASVVGVDGEHLLGIRIRARQILLGRRRDDR